MSKLLSAQIQLIIYLLLEMLFLVILIWLVDDNALSVIFLSMGIFAIIVLMIASLYFKQNDEKIWLFHKIVQIVVIFILIFQKTLTDRGAPLFYLVSDFSILYQYNWSTLQEKAFIALNTSSFFVLAIIILFQQQTLNEIVILFAFLMFLTINIRGCNILYIQKYNQLTKNKALKKIDISNGNIEANDLQILKINQNKREFQQNDSYQSATVKHYYNEYEENQLRKSPSSCGDRSGPTFDENSVWRSRLNGIPLAIALVDKKKLNLVFKNKCLHSLFIKVLDVNGDQDQQDTLLHKLKFKFIQQTYTQNKNSSFKQINFRQPKGSQLSVFDDLHSIMSVSRKKKNKTIDNGTMNSSDQSVGKYLSIKKILKKLKRGELTQYINDDQIMEMYSQRQNLQLNCKIMLEQESDYMIILQDFSKQTYTQQMEQQNQFKTKMINSFSHELRTPLNSAHLFLKTCMMDEDVQQTTKTDYIIPCLSSLQRQNILINDIIDFSLINASQFDVDFSVFSIPELIEELKSIFIYEFSMKKMGLAFNIFKDVPQIIKSDKQRLMQILVNILQNAQKFSTNGYVYIRISAGTNNIINFNIQDEGCGIDFERLNQIKTQLDQFNQDNFENQDWEGFGLVISQMILRFIGPFKQSDLKIESNGSGQGTQVQFSIFNYLGEKEFSCEKNPREYRKFTSDPQFGSQQGLIISIQSQSKSTQIFQQTSDHQRKEQEEVEDDLDGGYIDKIMSQYCVQSSAFLFKQTSSSGPSQQNIKSPLECNCHHILSVDDEIFNQTALTVMLNKIGFEVDVAFHGQQAIEMIHNKQKCSPKCKKYILILMDCQMPIMDGWETTRKLTEMFDLERLQFIPIVGLTAYTTGKDIDLCYKAGMQEVLSKPLNLIRFKQVLNRLGVSQSG